MDYLNKNSAPAREERLKAGIAFGGTCSELKGCLKKGCMNAANRSFSQTHGCQFTLSLGIINTLRNVVVIMHAPIGCGACTTSTIGLGQSFKQLRDPNSEGTIWLSTNLDEADVINGGEKKLRQAVLYAEKEFRPESIIVANACVPALIGDDIDTILNDLQNQVSADLVAVNCEGFKTKVMATAYDAAYNGILKKYIYKPDRKKYLIESDLDRLKEQYKINRKVNIFNVGSMSRADELELERLLNAIGLNVTFLPCYSSPEDFSYSLEGSLNVSICGTHDDYYLEHIKSLYNIPFLIDTIPIGRKNTDRWILKIAEHFDLVEEAKLILKKENELLDKRLEEFRHNLKGKKVFLGGGELRIVATGEIIQDLRMEIVGFKGHHIDKFIEPSFDALENIDNVTFNVATQHPFEQANLINKLKPDVIVIHTGGNNISAKHGLPLLPLFGATYNYMGYSGVYEVARRLNRIIKNSQFNKNIAKNKPLPYKKQWYDENPFAYIKDQEFIKI